MSFLDRAKAEFIDIIDWPAMDKGVLAYKFKRFDNEIKNGAKLTVREGQAAVFVNEGKMADVFKPGMYSLTTENLPILATLKGWKYGFHSPYKADVYFVNMALQTEHKWGTSNPIMLRDKDFGIVRLRGFGTYIFRITDPGQFLREIVAADPSLESYEVEGQLRHVMVARFSDAIGKSGISALDLAGNYDSLATRVLEVLKADFAGWGLEITKFFIENLSLPPEVEQAIDKRSAMGAIGDLGRYTQMQAADAIRAAADSSGAAGAIVAGGVGIGAGFAVAQQMAGGLQQAQAPGSQPPPLPGAAGAFHVAIGGQSKGPLDLAAIKALVSQGQVTRDSLVWRQGMAGWTKASEVSELQPLFAAVPPPLPTT